MRAWLFVLAVLATFNTVQQVASTEEVKSSSKSSSSSTRNTNSLSTNLISLDTSILDSSSSLDSSALDSSSYSNSLENSDNLSNNNIDKEFNNINNNNMNREKPDPQTLVQIEKNLLSLFGFTKRPKVDRSKIVIPEAMKQLYAQIMGHELDSSIHLPKAGLHTKNANTVRSFTHEESKIDDRFKYHHRFRLYFNISHIPDNEKLKAAELTLNRNQIENAENVRHQIFVYDIVRPGNKVKKREPIFLLIDTKSVSLNDTGTVSLDVLPAVERWNREPKSNHGLLIHITSLDDSHTIQDENMVKQPVHQHIRLRRSIHEKPEKWAHSQPLLFTYTDDGRYKQRSIRDAIKNQNQNRNRRTPRRGHRRKDSRDICQRRPLYVDFSDVGWSDWIVAPPGYEAFYCHGECTFPIADHLNTTNHAIVQTLVNSLYPSLAPKACCVPTQLSSICMLYLDDQNKVVLKNYQDMTVVGCGCR